MGVGQGLEKPTLVSQVGLMARFPELAASCGLPGAGLIVATFHRNNTEHNRTLHPFSF
jgi:hypothetical protein